MGISKEKQTKMKCIFRKTIAFVSFILREVFVCLVKIYQWTISPLFPSACRYTPTCSAYAIEALRVWGPFKGLWLTIKRLSHCHPWGGSGVDLVPKKNNDSPTSH